jgi:molybdopterin/thiamine biosynthesis adenylyltransferase
MSPSSPELSRSYGFWNEEEQQALLDSHVAIAGVGGDGFQLGVKLARMGVQSFSVADPEVFEPENANRVPGAARSTYGSNKAEVFREEVLDINKDAQVRVFTEGVTPGNVQEFMQDATLVLDESELTHLELGAMISDETRRQKIPTLLVMNVGFAAIVTSFDPESKHSFRRMMGIPEDMPLDEVAERTVDFTRCLPYVPSYTDLRTLMSVQQGESLPSISPGVDIASGMGSTQAFLHITRDIKNNRRDPVWAPRMMYMDAYTGSGSTVRYPRIAHYLSRTQAALRQILGRVPEADYTPDSIERRRNMSDNVPHTT